MLSSDQLEALGVEPGAAHAVQASQYVLPEALVDVTVSKGRVTTDGLGGVDTVEFLEELARPLDDDSPLEAQERALRVAYLADAAGALGLGLHSLEGRLHDYGF